MAGKVGLIEVYTIMKPHNFSDSSSDGTLFAYLNKDIDEALAESAQQLLETDAGQNALAQLADMDQWLIGQIGGLNVPDSQDLVDVVAGQATDQQKLIVAAYVRNSVRGRNEMQMLEEALSAGQEPLPAKLFQLPQFVAVPLQALSGLRSAAAEERQQAFMVAELHAQVTLRIAPPIDMRWHLEGYITQEYLPTPKVRVTLAQDGAAGLEVESDLNGFFSFSNLDEGSYTMQAHVEQGVIIIQEINLLEMD